MDLEVLFEFLLQLGALHLCEGVCGINKVGDVVGAGVGWFVVDPFFVNDDVAVLHF